MWIALRLGGGGVGVILYKVGTVFFFIWNEMFYFKKRVGTSVVDSELLLQGVRVSSISGQGSKIPHTMQPRKSIYWTLRIYWASLVAQVVKNLLGVQETWVRSLGREDPLEKGMATHSNILAWRIPGTEEGYSPWGHKESDMTKWLTVSGRGSHSPDLQQSLRG